LEDSVEADSMVEEVDSTVAVEAGSMEEVVVGLTVGKGVAMNLWVRRVARGAAGEIHTNSFRPIVAGERQLCVNSSPLRTLRIE
jgi:hypothetical protein